MVQIVLIRPGTSEFDEQGRIQGTLDIPLTEQGQREVQQSIVELKPLGLSIVYSSPCEAAWQTASAIASGLGIKAKQLDALENLDHGLWQGLQREEVKRKQPKVFRQWQEHPEMVCPPEGEMYCDFRARVEAALAKSQKKHRGGAIGVVVPEPLASIVHCVLTHAADAEEWQANPSGAAWEVVGENLRSIQFRGGETLVPRTANTTASPTPVSPAAAILSPDRVVPIAKNTPNSCSISPAVSVESGT